jgi:peptidoglycan/LPS O-acetylase OafA/YrhL
MKRNDVQVLRAAAVLLVVGYHAGLKIPSGFLGVDIFFVISGFVISRALLNELTNNHKINISSFYWKRYKRLMPNLTIMLLFVFIFSLITLSPLGPIQNVSITGIGSLFSLANVVIAYVTGSYFSPPASSNPLTHTWSLSVEEQFYFVLPLLIAVTFLFVGKNIMKAKKTLFVSISVLTIFSLIVALYNAKLDPLSLKSQLAGYYSPLTRVWEFGFGILAALSKSKIILKKYAHPLISISLFLVFGSTLMPSHFYDVPGLYTVIPVIGTMGILLLRGFDSTLLPKIFDNRFLLWIGDRSYSIYLWHWPFIVFARVLFPDNRPILLSSVCLSFIPALYVYHKFENPLRHSMQDARYRKKLLLFTFCTLIPITIGGFVGYYAQHFMRPGLSKITGFYKGEVGHQAYYESIANNFSKCEPILIRKYAPVFLKDYIRCDQSKDASFPPQVAIIGDSHAEDLFYGIAKNLPKKNVVFYIQADLPVSTNPLQKRILNFIAQKESIRDVIINASWASRGFPESQLSATITQLLSAGKQVYISDDRPFFSDPTTCKFGIAGIGPSMYCTKGIKFEEKILNTYYPKIKELLILFPKLHFLPTFEKFCNSLECSMTNKDHILYRDFTHLNVDGSLFLWDKLFQDRKLRLLLSK